MTEDSPVTYQERNRNPLNRWLNRRLDKVTERETRKYIERYATRPDGSRDEALADRIRYELMRRSQMGREIDVLEPGRWTVYSFLISAVSGAAAKAAGGKLADLKEPGGDTGKTVKKTLIGTAIAGFFSFLVMGARILSLARFKAGLYAGAQTALALHKENFPIQLSGQGSAAHQETPLIAAAPEGNIATAEDEKASSAWLDRASEKTAESRDGKKY